MMKKYEAIYQELKQQFSDADIAESYMVPADESKSARKASNEEIKQYRFERLKEMTEEQRLLSELMRLRFLMEEYIQNEEFSENNNFGSFLEEYVKIIRKTKKEFSKDIDLHYTKLSRLFSGTDDPNIDIIYRIEEHAGKLIPAVLWWKLLVKKQEHQIQVDNERRNLEARKVSNALKFRA